MITQFLAKFKWHLIVGALVLSFIFALVWNFYQGIEDKATMKALQEQNEVLKQEKQLLRVKYEEERNQLKIQVAELREEKSILTDENKRIRQYNENLLNNYRIISSELGPRPNY